MSAGVADIGLEQNSATFTIQRAIFTLSPVKKTFSAASNATWHFEIKKTM